MPTPFASIAGRRAAGPTPRADAASGAAWNAAPQRWWHFTVLGLAFALLLVARRPEMLLRAELFADNGWLAYPDAYRAGWRSLLLPAGDCFNTVQRLAALLAQPFPLPWAPTLFALAGFAVQIAAPLFLISLRMAKAWPNGWARLAFALTMLVLPNGIETFIDRTGYEWNLAVLAFLVLAADPAATRTGRVFDAAILLLSGLSGPFCLMLAPVAAWRAMQDRGLKGHLARLGLVLLACAVQLAALLRSPHGLHPGVPLGAGATLLARIVALQVMLGAEIGYDSIRWVPGWDAWQTGALPVSAFGLGMLLAGLALLRASSLLRQFALFAGLVLVAALLDPHLPDGRPQWHALANPPTGNRFFACAIIAWIGMLYTLAARPELPARAAGGTLLVILYGWGVPRDFRHLPFRHTDFQARARAFEAAPPGTVMEFPLIPAGQAPMILVKHGPR